MIIIGRIRSDGITDIWQTEMKPSVIPFVVQLSGKEPKLTLFQSCIQQKWLHQNFFFNANAHSHAVLLLPVTKETKLSPQSGSRRWKRIFNMTILCPVKTSKNKQINK